MANTPHTPLHGDIPGGYPAPGPPHPGPQPEAPESSHSARHFTARSGTCSGTQLLRSPSSLYRSRADQRYVSPDPPGIITPVTCTPQPTSPSRTSNIERIADDYPPSNPPLTPPICRDGCSTIMLETTSSPKHPSVTAWWGE